jgi:hypothetical protein
VVIKSRTGKGKVHVYLYYALWNPLVSYTEKDIKLLFIRHQAPNLSYLQLHTSKANNQKRPHTISSRLLLHTLPNTLQPLFLLLKLPPSHLLHIRRVPPKRTQRDQHADPGNDSAKTHILAESI